MIYKFTSTKSLRLIKSELDGINFKSEWLSISDRNLSIPSGYSWDGCSPKFKLFGITLGTPDGKIDKVTGHPKTYFASMVHDAIYQYKKSIPISRLAADKIFYSMLKNSGFKYSLIYYLAVRLFGGLYGKWLIK